MSHPAPYAELPPGASLPPNSLLLDSIEALMHPALLRLAEMVRDPTYDKAAITTAVLTEAVFKGFFVTPDLLKLLKSPLSDAVKVWSGVKPIQNDRSTNEADRKARTAAEWLRCECLEVLRFIFQLTTVWQQKQFATQLCDLLLTSDLQSLYKQKEKIDKAEREPLMRQKRLDAKQMKEAKREREALEKRLGYAGASTTRELVATAQSTRIDASPSDAIAQEAFAQSVPYLQIPTPQPSPQKGGAGPRRSKGKAPARYEPYQAPTPASSTSRSTSPYTIPDVDDPFISTPAPVASSSSSHFAPISVPSADQHDAGMQSLASGSSSSRIVPPAYCADYSYPTPSPTLSTSSAPSSVSTFLTPAPASAAHSDIQPPRPPAARDMAAVFRHLIAHSACVQRHARERALDPDAAPVRVDAETAQLGFALMKLVAKGEAAMVAVAAEMLRQDVSGVRPMNAEAGAVREAAAGQSFGAAQQVYAEQQYMTRQPAPAAQQAYGGHLQPAAYHDGAANSVRPAAEQQHATRHPAHAAQQAYSGYLQPAVFNAGGAPTVRPAPGAQTAQLMPAPYTPPAMARAAHTPAPSAVPPTSQRWRVAGGAPTRHAPAPEALSIPVQYGQQAGRSVAVSAPATQPVPTGPTRYPSAPRASPRAAPAVVQHAYAPSSSSSAQVVPPPVIAEDLPFDFLAAAMTPEPEEPGSALATPASGQELVPDGGAEGFAPAVESVEAAQEVEVSSEAFLAALLDAVQSQGQQSGGLVPAGSGEI